MDDHYSTIPGGGGLRVAVIGAGMAGLTAARMLRDAGFKVTVFERSRGLGGRLATRRQGMQAFDHGSTYFSTTTPAFAEQVASWQEQESVGPWLGRFGTLTRNGFEREVQPVVRYVGTPGMNEAVRALAVGLDIRLDSNIVSLAWSGNNWGLIGEQGVSLGGFDCVVTAVPAPNARQLLPSLVTYMPDLAAVRMGSVWATVVGFEKSLFMPFDGASVSDSPIDWVARNNSKPGRARGETWVLHATPKWSAEHLEDSPEQISRMMTDAFLERIGRPREPSWMVAHRWRHAQATRAAGRTALFDRIHRVVSCGDWCLGQCVEHAWHSGRSAALLLIDMVNESPDIRRLAVARPEIVCR